MSKRIEDYSEEHINARVNEGRIPILEPKRWVKDYSVRNLSFDAQQISYSSVVQKNVKGWIGSTVSVGPGKVYYFDKDGNEHHSMQEAIDASKPSEPMSVVTPSMNSTYNQYDRGREREREREKERREREKERREREKERKKEERESKAKASKLYQEGLDLYGKYDFEQALEKFKEACKYRYLQNYRDKIKQTQDKQIKVTKAEELYKKGLALYKKYDFEQALKQFNKAYETCLYGHPNREIYMKEINLIREEYHKVKKAKDLYEEGLVSCEEYDLKKALKQFNKAYKTCPDGHPSRKIYMDKIKSVKYEQAKVLSKQAEKLEADGEYSEAIKKYDKAIALNTSKKATYIKAQARVLYRWGDDLLENKKDYESALAKFKEAESVVPGESPKAICRDSQARVLTKWAEKLEADGEYSEAIKKCREAIALNTIKKATYIKAQTAILNNWGCLLARKKDYEAGLEKFKEAAKLDRTDKLYHLNKSIILTKLNRYEEAVESADTALRIDPDYQQATVAKAEALNNWAKKLEAEGEYSEAIKKYDEAIALNTSNKDAYTKAEASTFNDWGIEYLSQKNNEAALVKFAKAIILNSSQEEYHYFKIIALTNLGRYEEAVNSADTALRMNPSNQFIKYKKALALNNWAEKLKAEKEYSKAIQKYDEAITLNTSNKGFYIKAKDDLSSEIAKRYDAEGSKLFDEAMLLFKQAINSKDSIAVREESIKKFREARDTFLKASEYDQRFTEKVQNTKNCITKLAETFLQNADNRYEVETSIIPLDTYPASYETAETLLTGEDAYGLSQLTMITTPHTS